MDHYHCQISDEPIDEADAVFAAGEGAECRFLGVVREEEEGRPISGIDYTAYRPMADAELDSLCRRALEERGPHRVQIRHRLGFVPAREPSILIQVTTRHSAEAFELCRWYLKEIKTRVPIWKKPVHAESRFDSGSSAS